MIMEIRGHGGITHFRNSEGKGGVKVWYGYFLESPIKDGAPRA